MKLKVNQQKTAGRPAGRKTLFPGITAFCREHGYAHQHVREVLTGKRQSPRVRGLWRAWQSERMAR